MKASDKLHLAGSLLFLMFLPLLFFTSVKSLPILGMLLGSLLLFLAYKKDKAEPKEKTPEDKDEIIKRIKKMVDDD